MSVVAVSPLKFHNFDTLPSKMIIHNNGRTITLSGNWAATQTPFIVGSDLAEKYRFSHLHFHWSSEDNIGSEHVINGQKHTMEMHAIFFKDSCGTISEAESQRNSYLTLAYLFDITPNQHVGFERITVCLNDIQAYDQSIEIPVFRLSNLLDQSPGEYFTYTGKAEKSQGTYNISKWIVFTKIYQVNSQQVEKFRQLLNKSGQPIKHNCRTAMYAASNRDGKTNATAVLYLVKKNFASNDNNLQTDQNSDIMPVDNQLLSRVLYAKPTKTHLLRRKFNLEKVMNIHSHKTSNVVKTLPFTYSKNTIHPKMANHNNKDKETITTNPISTKPSWK